MTEHRALGRIFESEIREQPDIWERVADSSAAAMLADRLRGVTALFIGSGSSLFVAQLAALAFRRRGIRATAVAATEVPLDSAADRDAVVVALSQSGESADLLRAIDLLEPQVLVALTNAPASSLARGADVVIDALAGPERAVPATKSVTSMAAIVLWAASIAGTRSARSARSLREAACDVRAWLDGPDTAVTTAAEVLARRRGVIVAGTGYGVPVASELALKLKEASYVHAEGFAAGEFRHGSSAVLDESMAIVGIVDAVSHATVHRLLSEAADRGAAGCAIGAATGDDDALGPKTGEAFNVLAWLVAGQMLALQVGRRRGVDGDAPRGLSKALT